MRDIKKEYKKYITMYFIVYILLNIVIIFSEKISGIDIEWLIKNEYLLKTITAIIITPLISLLSLVILNIIPTNIKNVLVFWKCKMCLPSYRWQKKIKSDSRINANKIEKQYGKNLSNQEQHDIWYKIYKQNETDIRIMNSQRDYLWARDFCISTIILIPITIVIYIIGRIYFDTSIVFMIANLIILLITYLITMIVARNNSNSFICNVLITDYVK